MSIKDQLTEDMKQAMKDREAGKLRLSVIRMVRANIKNVEINEKKELNDDEVLAILLKEVKMRQDEPLSDEELRVMVAEAISETGAEGPKAIGKVMPAVMAKAKGRADGKRINQMVRELLQ